MMTGESMNKANISRFDIPLPGNAAPAVSVVETLRGAGFEQTENLVVLQAVAQALPADRVHRPIRPRVDDPRVAGGQAVAVC